jgi:hypothetical protein
MADFTSTDATIEERIAAAELEKLYLENQKLRSEGRGHWSDRLTAFIPLLSAIIAVAGFLFGVYQFQSQQHVRDATSRLEQELLLQNRIRTNVDALLQYVSSEKETLSSAAYRVNDLKTLVRIAASTTPPIRTDVDAITRSLVQEVAYDLDLKNPRHSAFVAMLVREWPNYTDQLRANPLVLRRILSKYIIAVRALFVKAPNIFANASCDSNRDTMYFSEHELSEDDEYAMALLLTTFKRHAQMFPDKADEVEQAGVLAGNVNNYELARCLFGIKTTEILSRIRTSSRAPVKRK